MFTSILIYKMPQMTVEQIRIDYRVGQPIYSMRYRQYLDKSESNSEVREALISTAIRRY